MMSVKQNISKSLKKLMAENKLNNLELSRIVGVSESTVGKWLLEKSVPRMGIIEQLSDYFGVPKSYFLEEERPLPSNIIPLTKGRKLPIVGSIAAGKPILVTEDIEDYILIDNNIKGDLALKVHGDSMMDANILDGDLAIIQKNCSIENGEIYAVAINEEATLKKLYKNNDSYILQPCNSNYEPIIVKEEDNPYIVGKLTAVVRKY